MSISAPHCRRTDTCNMLQLLLIVCICVRIERSRYSPKQRIMDRHLIDAENRAAAYIVPSSSSCGPTVQSHQPTPETRRQTRRPTNEVKATIDRYLWLQSLTTVPRTLHSSSDVLPVAAATTRQRRTTHRGVAGDETLRDT